MPENTYRGSSIVGSSGAAVYGVTMYTYMNIFIHMCTHKYLASKRPSPSRWVGCRSMFKLYMEEYSRKCTKGCAQCGVGSSCEQVCRV